SSYMSQLKQRSLKLARSFSGILKSPNQKRNFRSSTQLPLTSGVAESAAPPPSAINRFLQVFQPVACVQAPPRKINHFLLFRNNAYLRSTRPDERGVRVVTNVGRAAMDARAAPDGRRERGRSSRAVPIPRRWDQACLAITRAGDGGSQARHSEEITKQPLKPIARGRPDCPVVPVDLPVCVLLAHFCTRGARVQRHPVFPAPSPGFEGMRCITRAGGCRGEVKVCLASVGWAKARSAVPTILHPA